AWSSKPRAGARLAGFDLPVRRGLPRLERSKQAARDVGDLVDRLIKRRLVDLRRMREAAELTHELQRGGADFLLGRRRLEIEQRADVAAHGRLLIYLWFRHARE